MKSKTTSFKLSDQVYNILHSEGLSKIFNYNDFEYFKKQCKQAFDKAQAIADRFKEYYSDVNSDYNDYVY